MKHVDISQGVEENKLYRASMEFIVSRSDAERIYPILIEARQRLEKMPPSDIKVEKEFVIPNIAKIPNMVGLEAFTVDYPKVDPTVRRMDGEMPSALEAQLVNPNQPSILFKIHYLIAREPLCQ
jgi:hypothetical protein